MLRIPKEELRRRCEAIRQEIPADKLEIAVAPLKSVIGGGTTPGSALDSFGISLRHRVSSPSALLAALRRQAPPVIGRVQEDCVLLDLRTVPQEQDKVLARAVRDAAEEDHG
jgi:L-seryl-tRNA(Ser) seleniumtransferase